MTNETTDLANGFLVSFYEEFPKAKLFSASKKKNIFIEVNSEIKKLREKHIQKLDFIDNNNLLTIFQIVALTKLSNAVDLILSKYQADENHDWIIDLKYENNQYQNLQIKKEINELLYEIELSLDNPILQEIKE